MSALLKDVTITGGTCKPDVLIPPTACIDNDAVEPDAGLDATKLEHQHHQRWSQPNTAATAETRALHVAYAAGEVIDFRAGSIAAAIGNSTVTIDLKKNGTTVLSAPIVLDSGNTAYVAEAGTISVGPYTAGDVFTLVQTISAGSGTLPTGVYGEMAVREACGT